MINENWRKSSYSSGGADNCVEVCGDTRAVNVRDTQHRSLGRIDLSHRSWAAFLREVKAGRL